MVDHHLNSFNSRSPLTVGGHTFQIFRLEMLEKAGVGLVSRLPFSIKILLENMLRLENGRSVQKGDIEALARWNPAGNPDQEISFTPSRVLMQDLTGVPAVVDLAAMRDAIHRMGGDPKKINPLQPTDLVIDHSVQIDRFGSPDALRYNAERAFERNRERFAFLRWGQGALQNYRVVPPDTGIVHQVNLEYLAKVVFTGEQDGVPVAYPDTLVGLDSHTTMINGLGIVGWGVGGIEAEAAMLGQPISILIPAVVGVKLIGELSEGVTATDLVLTITQILRTKGVVGQFVEFYGPGLSNLGLANRATLGNMAPEYGATIGFFPVDEETLRYLRLTGRDEELVRLVEAYTKAQGLFRTDATPDPLYSASLEVDLASIESSLAGPSRPQDRVPLRHAKQAFRQALIAMLDQQTQSLDQGTLKRWVENGDRRASADAQALGPLARKVSVRANGEPIEVGHGTVVIAAITSCTNTSNPAVIIGAGLLAKKAVERGLNVKPWVKTSLAPGSKVVTEYLKETGLIEPLERLRFHVAGYGCTTCIGNSGPLPEPVAQAIQTGDLVVAAVLSGNRNFEGRIHQLVRANYLASPPLVVAYALAGRMDLDLYNDPLGHDSQGQPVYLRDLWPTQEEIRTTIASAVKTEMFRKEYGAAFRGDERWNTLDVPTGDLFAWDPHSTYVRQAPYFDNMPPEPAPLTDIRHARILALLGDSVTTDHISPAGEIPVDTPAGRYLIEHGVTPQDFNIYGARRGNHEVMVRGTFANIRLRNRLVPGTEGGWTVHLPDGERMAIYDAALKYQAAGVPLVVIAGKEYGCGSSRDWAAKGTLLLGVRAVIAQSYERIHRSNLIGMGVLPLQFKSGETPETLGLTGVESYTIEGIAGGVSPGKPLTVRARRDDGSEAVFTAITRIETPDEVAYYQHGGILPYVLRQLLKN
jgi:aconitate hydratase A / 2-methylisocitrate dehydratase